MHQTNLTENIEIEMTEELLSHLDCVAGALGKSRDEIIRAATQDFLFLRDTGEFLTRNEVCSMLKVSRTSLARLMARAENPLPHTRYSKTKVRFYGPEVRAWLKKK